ncbi:uncharacterized protein LOC119100624 [Pollicipes pollicipes]|uniref:uncharacterized protein LOC119100624 n=1 Tax=Pollicipes pollicipes TaxID=41117 RepID=UPI001884AA0D|nr:uncharacterized protein LOC119100624 [Pollicipes pollicipes]
MLYKMDHPYLNVTDPVFTRRLHHVTYGVIAPLLVTAGIVGNVVCLPCLAAPRRWGVTRFFLVVLSSVDTAIMLCLIPTLWLLAVTTCASIGTVVALTVDRFVSVCRQMEFKLVHRREVALRRVVVVFCASSAAWNGYVIFGECLTRLLPMTALVALNWRIAAGFQQMVTRAAALSPPPHAQREASVASILVVGLIPGTVTTLYLLYVTSPSKALDVAIAAANLLEIANFSSNYLFYLLFNKRLRKSLAEFYRNLFRRKDRPISIDNA